MVGDERVYELIDKMFVAAKECFTSRRINVGMDEAFALGRGKYQDLHGVRSRMDILTEHLAKVVEIAKNGCGIIWTERLRRLMNYVPVMRRKVSGGETGEVQCPAA